MISKSKPPTPAAESEGKMDKQYTVEEINRAIEFTESVLQGFDEMIGSGKYTVEEVNTLLQRRSQTLMFLNQWKSKLSGEKDKPNDQHR